MGGEWYFCSFSESSCSNLNIEKYHNLLKTIKESFRETFPQEADKDGVAVIWFEASELVPEPTDNIFAQFSYPCNRNCFNKEHEWNLLWHPAGNLCKSKSNIFTRCASYIFRTESVKIQKMLTSEFPEHFQLYLGDGVSGLGPECNQYFGIIPEGHVNKYFSDSDCDVEGDLLWRQEPAGSDSDGHYDNDYNENEDSDLDYTACGSDCDHCGKCWYD